MRLPDRFDAFGGDELSQRMGDADDAAHDGRCLAGLLDGGDEEDGRS